MAIDEIIRRVKAALVLIKVQKDENEAWEDEYPLSCVLHKEIIEEFEENIRKAEEALSAVKKMTKGNNAYTKSKTSSKDRRE